MLRTMNRPAPHPSEFDSLTTAERDCLRFILDHRTAKEIAIELGITHHAVEKRLKRAREKLGAQSSLEAARWYAAHYGEAAYGAPDLPKGAVNDQHSVPSSRKMARTRSIAIMSILSFAAVALLVTTQSVPGTINAADLDPEDLATGLERSLAEEVRVAHSTFGRMDRNGSNFLERDEFVAPPAAPLTGDENGEPKILLVSKDRTIVKTLDNVDQSAIRIAPQTEEFLERREAMFALLDRDKDGKISKTEFTDGYLEGIGPKTFTIRIETD